MATVITAQLTLLFKSHTGDTHNAFDDYIIYDNETIEAEISIGIKLLNK